MGNIPLKHRDEYTIDEIAEAKKPPCHSSKNVTENKGTFSGFSFIKWQQYNGRISTDMLDWVQTVVMFHNDQAVIFLYHGIIYDGKDPCHIHTFRGSVQFKKLTELYNNYGKL